MPLDPNRKNVDQRPLTEYTGQLLLEAVQALGGGVATGSATDRSGTITTGGTSQELAPALPTRTYIEIQNVSDETMYINFDAPAKVDDDSFKIVAGDSWNNPAQFCPTGAITIIGATTGKKFVAKEF